jgi:diguanylate cyclase (GGDEF)-like protein
MYPPRASSCVAPKLSGFVSERVLRQEEIDSYGLLNYDDEESFTEAVRLAANVCGTPAAMLSFIDRGRQWPTARIGLDAVECPRALFLCAQAVRVPDQVMVVPDVAEDPLFTGTWGQAGQTPFRFYAGAPLVAPLGIPFGTISVIDRTRRALTESQVMALQSLARQIVRELALAHEINTLRIANAKLTEISMTDALTCVANRRAFNEGLAAEETRARRTGEAFSLLLMDVDHFKLFNDRHGHLAGDEALLKIAHTLKSNNRGYDLLARYGGEEFALILPQTNTAAAAAAAERLRAAVEGADMPLQRMTLSIGVASFDPARGTADLVSAADRALYAAKAAGRNRVGVFQQEAGSTE